jgi:pimeloyl-ACP methyl ester carboxylesterase
MNAHFARPWLSALALVAATASAQSTVPPAVPPAAAHKVVDASFPCQQVTCDAEMWLPAQTPAGQKPPVILIAHGFGGLKDWGLPAFAERFVQAGFAVVRFDYRGFGKSGGQPRRVVDGKAHVQDWLSAIDAISKRPEVDGQRLGIWGTSYSGGQVLVAGAERPNVVKAVSAQVPFVSGLSSGLRYPIKYQPMATWYALRDLMRGEDEEPVYVPVIDKDGGFAALICDECYEGYKKLVPAAAQQDPMQNRVAARVFLSLPFWFPGNRAKDVIAPTLIVAAENDGLIPVAKVRDVAKSLPKGEYLELKGADHFSPYTGPFFEQTVARQTTFFKQHLMR